MRTYLHPDPKTFQDGARCVLNVLELDGNWRDIDKSFTELFDEGLYANVAAKAAHLLGWGEDDGRDPHVVGYGDSSENVMVALLASKQHDYGPGSILRFGKEGILVRLFDKISRYDNLVTRRGADPRNEAVSDTLWDMIGYVVLYKMVNQGWFTLPLGRF